MPRIARVVVPGLPHHVTQRGNRRQKTFFRDDDYRVYLDLMREWCGRHGVRVWAYCLMSNHVHLVCVPETADALACASGAAHRPYTRGLALLSLAGALRVVSHGRGSLGTRTKFTLIHGAEEGHDPYRCAIWSCP